MSQESSEFDDEQFAKFMTQADVSMSQIESWSHQDDIANDQLVAELILAVEAAGLELPSVFRSYREGGHL